MSDDRLPSAAGSPPQHSPPRASLRRRRFSFVWLIPLVAAGIAGYLGYRTILEQGPLLTLTFQTAEGLAVGQTQIKYKAVAIGTVESIDLSKNNSEVVVQLRMNNVGRRFLRSHAQFWVERPRFTPGDLTGLTTLVSGAFIAVDPGKPGGVYQTAFTGLEEPPGVRSNEPGRTYLLKADSIGSLGTGSPVFYRDVQVGEVLGYDVGNGLGPVTISIFVRAPFDNLVETQSHFWNSSGITAELTGDGFHVEMQSFQAVLSGGVTFTLPPDAGSGPPSGSNTVFTLYKSQDDANSAGYQNNLHIVSYFKTPVDGLVKGAPVDILGIQLGDVTDVRLIVDAKAGTAKVRVGMDLQPQRVVDTATIAASGIDPKAVLQNMVNQGFRAEVGTESYVTGQKEISLTKVSGAGRAEISVEDGALVLPTADAGLDKVIANLSDISGKLDKIPFEKIGDNLNQLLVTANKTVGGAHLNQTLQALSATLKTANNTLQSATTTLNGVNQDYGNDSDFQRNVGQLMNEAADALQSLKALTDYLDRHPSSLLLGRGAP